MHWLQTLDIETFRFLNLKLVNPVFDVLMPLISGNPLFLPVAVIAGIWLAVKGGARARVCLLMLALAVGMTDGVVCRSIKHAVQRPRPFLALEGVHQPEAVLESAGVVPGEPKTNEPPKSPAMRASASMPSSHAANWFAATIVFFIYYRRSLRLMLPIALAVSYSRIYNGVHYPSDILAGACLGAGTGAALVWSLDRLWIWAGRKWFPLWWARLPSLMAGTVTPPPDEEEQAFPMKPKPGVGGVTRPMEPEPPPAATLDVHWLHLGYLVVAALLVFRWAYLASGTIQLSEDEAYQWLWSKHLALSYYSKPPLVAYVQFLSTSIFGDTAFGVRFFAPLVSAIVSILVLRFFAREVNSRAGFLLLLALTSAPLVSVGALILTVDPLSVLFWTAAMLAGWKAAGSQGKTRDWAWVGLWMGLGFLSKYTELFQWLSWAVFFVLWKPARAHLRRLGPWLALAINLLCATPVLLWNAQHGWITVAHVGHDAKVGEAWHPTVRFLGDFLGAELGLLNPVFFVAALWASIAFWKRNRHNPRLVYFFAMGAPLFLVYLIFTLHSRVLPNWIAPSILPLYCLMAIYWDTKWRLGQRAVGRWFAGGLAFGLTMVVLAHQTNLVQKITGTPLPVNLDILHRVREWDETALAVGKARQDLLAEGKPVFIIADHYGMAGQISFYLPEARDAVSAEPLVYCRIGETPENQFYFWPGYHERKGENAIFVREISRDHVVPRPAPEQLEQEFESVTDLGVTNIMYHKTMLLRPLHLFACRHLK